jgi:hypothetical protein
MRKAHNTATSNSSSSSKLQGRAGGSAFSVFGIVGMRKLGILVPRHDQELPVHSVLQKAKDVIAIEFTDSTMPVCWRWNNKEAGSSAWKRMTLYRARRGRKQKEDEAEGGEKSKLAGTTSTTSTKSMPKELSLATILIERRINTLSLFLNLASFLNVSFVISLCLGWAHQPLHDRDTT